ncbi:MAG: hypothetical protein ACW98Y_14715 [Candidatus Thorarchaeota archaeon]|jgi:hypothetical protein
MVTGYEVSEDGTLQEIEMSKDDLDSTKVICIVDDATKSIYLWKGSQAGIRKKFIGARVATNLRTEYGFHMKVRPLDEGEEPPTFFTALEGTTAAVKVMKPGDKAPPPRPPTPKTEAKTEAAPAATTTAPPPTPKEKAPTTTSAPPPTTTSAPPPKPPVSAARPVAAAAPKASTSEIDMMIKELEAEEPPEGYQRELLIIYNELYTVAEHKLSVFGQEKIERKFEKVKDPPEGTFMAEGFIPRVIVKDGRVLGIELLKGTPDAILSPIKTEMKERLGDLISFFKSEVEEEGKKPSAKKTGKKGKKLVAK